MSAKSVYVTDVYRPGLSESKRFVFLDETECYEFTAAATATKWYRVETNVFEIQALVSILHILSLRLVGRRHVDATCVFCASSHHTVRQALMA